MNKNTKKEKEFYLFDNAQTGSFIIKNNVTYFINGFTDEDIENLQTNVYVSTSVLGTFIIRGNKKKFIGVPFTDKLLKMIFNYEDNSITIFGKNINCEEYDSSEIYEVKDFLEMCENIPILLKEQNVHKFTKRKYGKKTILKFK